MENPNGYVYRVGYRLGLRATRRREPVLFDSRPEDPPAFEPELLPALFQLSPRQRQAVVMVHALGWTHADTAELLGLSTSSVQRHVERGLKKLRARLGVDDLV